MHVRTCSRLSPWSRVTRHWFRMTSPAEKTIESTPPFRCVLTRSAARSDTRWRRLSWPRALDSFSRCVYAFAPQTDTAARLLEPSQVIYETLAILINPWAGRKVFHIWIVHYRIVTRPSVPLQTWGLVTPLHTNDEHGPGLPVLTWVRLFSVTVLSLLRSACRLAGTAALSQLCPLVTEKRGEKE